MSPVHIKVTPSAPVPYTRDDFRSVPVPCLWSVRRAVVLDLPRCRRAAMSPEPRRTSAGVPRRLARRGIRTSEFVFSSAGANRLAKALFTGLRDRAIELPNDQELISELQTARMIETGPGTVKLQNPAGTQDDVAVATGMCVVELLNLLDGLPAQWGGQALVVAVGREPSHEHLVGHDVVDDHRATAGAELVGEPARQSCSSVDEVGDAVPAEGS
jgi:hypothetical protein